MLIDTHTHLYDEQFDVDRDVMIENAIKNGIEKMIIPNVDSSTIEPMLAVCKKYPTNIFPMLGLHPCYVKNETYIDELAQIKTYLTTHKFVAIGEIGIDLHWDKTTLEIQKNAFNTQIDWAIEYNLPICIHSRESTSIIIEILKARKNKLPKGVFHCFTGSEEEAKEIIKLGFYVGIGGVVTYKNTHLRTTLSNISLQHILLETDSPYLPPVPYRGKRNESAYTKIVAETLCTIYQKGLDEIALITTQNATNLFQLT